MGHLGVVGHELQPIRSLVSRAVDPSPVQGTVAGSRSVIALYAIPKRCQETRNGTKFEKRLTFTDGVETRATGAKGA